VWPTAHFVNVERPYGGTLHAHYAVIARRHMHLFGTTEEHLAAVSHAIRYNASLNPAAMRRDAPSIEDVLRSGMVADPLTRLMCCMVNDGGAAFVMSTADRAPDLPKKPVYVLGIGTGAMGYTSSVLAKGSNGYDLVHTAGKIAADDAFREAGLSPDDVDLVTCCDNFAITPLIALEDYGFCKKGEGGDFVGDGSRIKVGGALPVNPHGGWMACSHAGIFVGTFVESVRQLQGDCGDRQVSGAQVAFHGASGGSLNTHSAAILANTKG
jgi:acetyl-CoA acetyltransferase